MPQPHGIARSLSGVLVDYMGLDMRKPDFVVFEHQKHRAVLASAQSAQHLCYYDTKRNYNTSRLYSQWFNSVIYWFINHCTDWTRTVLTSFCRQLIFMTLSITYGIVTLTIDGITSFLQLLDVQNVSKNKRFSLNKGCGKF